jgi:hypothetical protein
LTTKLAILLVTSEPEGAEVLIDDQPMGKTPFRFQASGLRTYRVGVRSIGYLPDSREVELKELGTTEVHVLLQRFGEIAIESNPAEAEIYIDEVFRGRTPQDFQLLEGKHTIMLRRAGKSPVSQQVEIVADEPLQVKVELLAENGTLTVLGLPKDCEVRLDGNPLGKAPIQRYIVSAGPHWLTYQADGYEPLKAPIWITVVGQDPCDPDNKAHETKITINPRIKTRWNALWRSLICPGMGQIYSEQRLKGILFLSAGAFCIAGTFVLHYQMDTAYDNYQVAHDRYVEEVSPYGIAAARQNMIAKHDLLREKVHSVNNLMFATAAVWALNCLDQILFSSAPWQKSVQTSVRLSFNVGQDPCDPDNAAFNQIHIGAQLALHW